MNSTKNYIAWLFIRLLPNTRFFELKSILLRWCGAEIGENVKIASSARFLTVGKLFVGNNVWIGHECLVIGGAADVYIGANCDIGPRVSLITGTHKLAHIDGKAAVKGYSEPIRLQDGVWIGACVTILGGVTIGKCSMVAAGSLVRENVPERVIVAGIPARVVKDFSE